jgi:hypothetical protein
MAAPIINPAVSLLTLTQGRYYELQLVEAVGSSAATGWQVFRGALPSGLSLNTSTGKISGTPNARAAEGSVWLTQIRATNGDGASTPLELTWGIERAEVEADGGIHAVFDLDTGAVAFPGSDQRTSDNRPVVHVRAGNKLPLTLILGRRGEVIDLAVSSVEVGGRQTADEPITRSFRAEDDTSLLKIGEGESTRYLVTLDLTSPDLGTDVASQPGRKGVGVPYISSIRIQWGVDMGGEAPEIYTRSSLEFWTIVHAESL